MHKYFDINEEGFSIRCKLYCDDPRALARVAVYCHGFGGHKDNRAAETFAQRFTAKWKGSGVVVFDLPCHGEDARKALSLAECDTYLGLVVDYVRRAFGVDELYAYGTSFGGFLLLAYVAAHGNPFRKVALRCPVINMHDTLTASIISPDEMRKIEAGKTVLVGFDRKVKMGARFLGELQAVDLSATEFFDYADDIVIVHGTADEIVSFDAARQFADDNVIQFVPVEGADHRFHDPKKMDAAIACIMDFFRS